LAQSGQRLRNGDIVAIASKVVSMSENRIINLVTVNPGRRSLSLSRLYGLTPELAQVVVDEADKIYGGVKGAVLTLKDGHATANAGVDRKNAPDNSVVLWPRNPKRSAHQLQIGLKRKTGKTVGVVIVDSRVTPLRLGTVGLSLASVGFRPVRDFRRRQDLNNRRIRITFQSMGDGIAAAAHVLMGEAKERIPFVIIRGAPVDADGGRVPSEKMHLENCLYMSQIRD
jgi:coenzyme F420-0:L-glutamate ligase / coenzyme F420-1:gamma-L-glutamate ligase